MPTTLTNRSILAVNLLGARHTGFTFVVAAQQAVHTLDFSDTANQFTLWASARRLMTQELNADFGRQISLQTAAEFGKETFNFLPQLLVNLWQVCDQRSHRLPFELGHYIDAAEQMSEPEKFVQRIF